MDSALSRQVCRHSRINFHNTRSKLPLLDDSGSVHREKFMLHMMLMAVSMTMIMRATTRPVAFCVDTRLGLLLIDL